MSEVYDPWQCWVVLGGAKLSAGEVSQAEEVVKIAQPFVTLETKGMSDHKQKGQTYDLIK